MQFGWGTAHIAIKVYKIILFYFLGERAPKREFCSGPPKTSGRPCQETKANDLFNRVEITERLSLFKVARNSFFLNGNLRFRSVFLENYYLFEDKEYFCYVKQHLKSSNSFTKVAQLPLLFLFQKIFLLGILNYFVDFKKNSIMRNHRFCK